MKISRDHKQKISREEKLRAIAKYKAEKEAIEFQKQQGLMKQFPNLFTKEKIQKYNERKLQSVSTSIRGEYQKIITRNIKENERKETKEINKRKEEREKREVKAAVREVLENKNVIPDKEKRNHKMQEDFPHQNHQQHELIPNFHPFQNTSIPSPPQKEKKAQHVDEINYLFDFDILLPEENNNNTPSAGRVVF